MPKINNELEKVLKSIKNSPDRLNSINNNLDEDILNKVREYRDRHGWIV